MRGRVIEAELLRHARPIWLQLLALLSVIVVKISPSLLLFKFLPIDHHFISLLLLIETKSHVFPSPSSLAKEVLTASAPHLAVL
jgi:hypothetical protein